MSVDQLTTEISEIEKEITDKTNLLGKIDAAIAGKMATRQSIEVSINQLNEKLTVKRNQKEEARRSESITSWMFRKFSSPEPKSAAAPKTNKKMKTTPKRTLRDELDEELATASRFDGRDHWPYVSEEYKSGLCKVCSGRTNMRCEKCDIALHPKCLKTFHV